MGKHYVDKLSTQLFEQFMAEHLFSQYVLQPTGDSNTVDLFLTTSAALVTHVDATTLDLLDRNRIREMVEVYPLPAVQTMSSQRPSTL